MEMGGGGGALLSQLVLQFTTSCYPGNCFGSSFIYMYVMMHVVMPATWYSMHLGLVISASEQGTAGAHVAYCQITCINILLSLFTKMLLLYILVFLLPLLL